jgi:hypothetical protein
VDYLVNTTMDRIILTILGFGIIIMLPPPGSMPTIITILTSQKL